MGGFLCSTEMTIAGHSRFASIDCPVTKRRQDHGRVFPRMGSVVGRSATVDRGVPAMLKFLGSASFAVVLTTIVGLLGSIPGWTLPLVAFVAFYFSLTAGMAWERAGEELRVCIGDLEYDDLEIMFADPQGRELFSGRGLFFVTLKNGGVPATPRVQIVGVRGGGKKPEHGYDAHWRGRKNQHRVLNAGEPQQFGLLVGRIPGIGNPGLAIWAHDDEFWPITKNSPLTEQGIITFDVTAVCESEPDKDGRKARSKLVERTFQITPDQQSPIGYRIVTDIKVGLAARSGWAKAYRHLLYLQNRLTRRTRHCH
jgi:hypothetical protein